MKSISSDTYKVGNRYIKVYPRSVMEHFEQLADTDVGLPTHEVIDGPVVYLVMEPARGYPLSIVLPTVLLPGVWSVTKARLLHAIKQLGEHLGRFHTTTTVTHDDMTPHNLYVDLQGNSTIIDFGMKHYSQITDVAIFESGIDLMVNRLPYARRSQQDSIIEAFHRGYLSTGPYTTISQDRVDAAMQAYHERLLDTYPMGGLLNRFIERLDKARIRNRW